MLAAVSAWNILHTGIFISSSLDLSMPSWSNYFHYSPHPHVFFSCDVVQTSLQHLIHSVSSTIKAASSAQELFPLMVDHCGHQGTWSLIKDTHVGGRWIASSLSGSFSVMSTNYFGWCQEQNPSLHWLQVGMPIRLWANDKDTWSRFLSSCG